MRVVGIYAQRKRGSRTLSSTKYRWYILVAVAWPILLCIGAVPYFLAMEALDHPRVRGDSWRTLLTVIYFLLIVGMLLWVFWIVPLLAVADMPRRSKLPPSKRIFGIRVFMLMPGVLPLSLVAMWMFVNSPDNQQVIVGFGAAGVVLIVIGHSLSKRAIRRLREACIRERICFECGYDLQGSPSLTCPECGYDSGTAAKLDSPPPIDPPPAN